MERSEELLIQQLESSQIKRTIINWKGNRIN